MNRLIHQLRGRLVRERGEARVRIDTTTGEQTVLVSNLDIEITGPDGRATLHLDLSRNPMIPMDVSPADVDVVVLVELHWEDPALPAGHVYRSIEATGRTAP